MNGRAIMRLLGAIGFTVTSFTVRARRAAAFGSRVMRAKSGG